MANEVTKFNPAQVPAYFKKGEVSALTKALAGGGGGFGKRLSIKGGVFRFMVDGKELGSVDDRYLDVVVIAAAPKIGRTWYAKKFTEEGNQAPACWSNDGEHPDATSVDVQSETCAACPKNVKGSGEGDSRACRFSQRIAIVLANDMEGNVMQLSVPAKSVFGEAEGDKHPLQSYGKWLSVQGMSAEQVITRLRFDTKEESPKLFFRTMRWLDEDEYEISLKQGQTKDAKEAIVLTVAQVNKEEAFQQPATKVKAKPADDDNDDDAPAPKAKAKAKADDDEPAAPKPKGRGKAKPKTDDDDDAPLEPKLKEKPAAVELAKKPGLMSVISDWEDE